MRFPTYPLPISQNIFVNILRLRRHWLNESYDKRYTPSTFIEEKGNCFRVGWFTKKATYHCVQEFSTLAEAATDYLLFSLGKGRWTP